MFGCSRQKLRENKEAPPMFASSHHPSSIRDFPTRYDLTTRRFIGQRHWQENGNGWMIVCWRAVFLSDAERRRRHESQGRIGGSFSEGIVLSIEIHIAFPSDILTCRTRSSIWSYRHLGPPAASRRTVIGSSMTTLLPSTHHTWTHNPKNRTHIAALTTLNEPVPGNLAIYSFLW